jgi:hypothetical protein
MKSYNFFLILFAAVLLIHSHEHTAHALCEIVAVASFAIVAFNIFRFSTQINATEAL